MLASTRTPTPKAAMMRVIREALRLRSGPNSSMSTTSATAPVRATANAIETRSGHPKAIGPMVPIPAPSTVTTSMVK